MSLPQFAPFPDANFRRSILPAEWGLYLDSWTSLAELYLRLKDEEFRPALSEGSSVTNFLISFFCELAHDDSISVSALALRKKCFFLLHRIYSGEEIPLSLLRWPVLSDFSRVFSRSAQFRVLLESLWARKGADIEKSFQSATNSLIKNLDSKRPEDSEETLNKIVPLLKVSPQAGTYLLTGSDFLDSLCSAYPKVPSSLQAKLTTIAYLGLAALLEGQKPKFSLLSDHLYTLKANGEQQPKPGAAPQTLVADLVTNTPFLNHIRDKATTPEATRVKNFAASLSAFQQSSIVRPKKLIRRKVEKGKAKAAGDEYGHGAFGDIHVHRMSLISQVQDLFPDLGSGFVAKLLHKYNDNVEEVTAHLLEDSLPPELRNADRSEQLFVQAISKTYLSTNRHRPATTALPAPVPIPHSPPPTYERRNKFDNDDFDKLAIDTSRLHIGRRNQRLTADDVLSNRSNAPSKSAILSALAAFDSDDDERDDTYDVEDVGGTIDSAAPGLEDANADKNEEALFKAYSSTPELFARDPETRRGKPRTALKSETGMTDEAIEGWGIMLGRNPKRLRQLEAKFSTFAGQQTELVSTSWRDSPTGSEGEASGDAFRGGRGGRGRGRGRGGGGRGRGNVAGPSADKATQIARQRKEANKGQQHRNQRAKKMARGGFAG
jgi:activating signal cointegrator complex subunit 2